MKTAKPSLAARALITMVEDLPVFRDGDRLAANLNLAGFKTIGTGVFAAVVEGRPGQVIKVFNRNDIGFQFLMNYSVEYPSIHLPKILSTTTSGKYGIVELERLEHKELTATRVSAYIDKVKCSDPPKGMVDTWGEEFRELILSLDYNVQKYNKANPIALTWDNHEGNILFNGKVPVLADVIFGEN